MLRDMSADGEQNRNILPHFADQRRLSLGVEFRFATGPIHALQLIDENCALYLVDGDGQGEWVGFALAREWTNTARPLARL